MNKAEKKLRKKLGMTDGQLLRTDSGIVADILDVGKDTVTIGILATGQVQKIPIERLRKR